MRSTGSKELFIYLSMILSFFFMGCGLVLILKTDLGMPPWDVFHLGLTTYVKLSYGQMIQLVGFLTILLSWVLGVRPQAGTFLNMFFIGIFVDLINKTALMPVPDAIYWRLLQFFCGVFIFSYGTVSYIHKNRGTGPRDSLMLAFNRITGIRLTIIRTIIEIVVTLVGFLLGGPLGIGTILFALTIGPSMELSQKLTPKRDTGTGTLSRN